MDINCYLKINFYLPFPAMISWLVSMFNIRSNGQIRSSGQEYSVVQFLFIRLSGFGLMDLPLLYSVILQSRFLFGHLH